MKRWLLGLCGVLLSGVVLAGGPAAVRQQVAASMVLTGTVVVAPDGSVRSYTIDKADKVPPAVLDLVRKTTAHWQFAPVLVNHSAVAARARMSMRVVATPVEGDNFSLAINGANFGDRAEGADGKHGAKLAPDEKRQPPAYPRDAVMARVGGTVYLLLQLDKQGHVVNVAAEQVNLGAIGSEAEMDHWRGVLARASVAAAKRWVFQPMPDRLDASGHRLARVPVAYTLRGDGVPRAPGYGQWQAYVPGPSVRPLWAVDDRMLSQSADAIPDTGVFPVSKTIQLVSPGHG